MMASLIPALSNGASRRRTSTTRPSGRPPSRPVQAASGEAATTIATAVDVQFRRSGRTLVWDGQDASLLDFAERHGIAVESGCRSGSCGSCETAIVSGTVRYAVKPDHDVAPGRCLLCVGTPGSALVLDA